MGIVDRIRNRFFREPTAIEPTAPGSTAIERSMGEGGMTAQLTDANPFSGFGYVKRQETNPDTYASLTNEEIQHLSIHKIRKIMARSAPSVSQALTNFQKYCNAGYSILPESHPILDGLMDSMAVMDSGFTGFINSLLDSLFLHGACFYETVYDDNLMPKRMVSLDVHSAVYVQEEGPLGQYYELRQWQTIGLSDNQGYGGYNNSVSLHNDPTIEYLTLFPETNDPYGRSFIDSALFHLIMVVDFFKAYKDVLASIVWPNLLMTVDREQIREEVSDPKKREGIVQKVLTRLREALKNLKPGSVITFGSEVKVGGMLSGMNRANLGGVEDFINILQKEVIRGLSTNQLLNALNDTVTETRARYEMADFAKLITHTQTLLNTAISRQFNIALRLWKARKIAAFMLKRTIYEEDRLQSEILRSVEEANKSADDSKMSLLQWLDEAVAKGRMDNEEANTYFKAEIERRDAYREIMLAA